MSTHIIAITNIKGGTAKTTSAAFLAHAYEQFGKTVMLVDADSTRKNGSLTKWSELAQWGIPTVGLATNTLHRQLPGIIGDRYDVVLIDAPPLEKEAGIVHSAMRAADTVLMPLSPSTMELAEVPVVLKAAEDVSPFREEPHRVLALLNRTVPNALSTKMFRTTLTELGCRVLTAEIRRLEPLAGAMGLPITGNLHGYLSAAEEIEAAR